MTPADLHLTTMAVAMDAHDDRDRARIVARALGLEDDRGALELLGRAFEAAHAAGVAEGGDNVERAWEEGYDQGYAEAKAEAT